MNTFSTNPALKEYVPLLINLRFLIAEGKSDTDEADAIREAMLEPWYKLKQEETLLVGMMAADLKMLEGKEINRNVPEEQRTREWLAPRLQEASAKQDWLTMLELLRNGPDFLTCDQLAWLRGQGYEYLGFPEVAMLFYKFVCQHTPELQISVLESVEAAA